MRIVLGFDFYGAGNIGDDLMVAGFGAALRALAPGSTVLGATAHDLESQRVRFPWIEWVRPGALAGRLQEEARAGAVWAGVGGTPFQLSAGAWFLERLGGMLPTIQRFGERVMVNIAAQDESLARAGEFAPIAGAMTRVSARDADSARVLVEGLGVARDRVRVGADLAHIALAELGGAGARDSEFELGVMPAADSLGADDVAALGRFLAARGGSVAVVCNEVRESPGMERAVARTLGGRWPVLVPPYARGTLDELAGPIRRCGTILTSRFHGALAGAWLGKRVAVIARSSRLATVARELDVPCVRPPLTADSIAAAVGAARAVPRARLEGLRRAALEGTAFALGTAVGGVRPAAALASVRELEGPEFRGFMAETNAFAAAHGLRTFTDWTKVWEYPWLWGHALSRVGLAGARLVDLGSELSPMPWLAALRGARVTLIETDGRFVPKWTALRETLKVDVDWRIVGSEKLPLPDGCADVVTSFSVIEHQPDKAAAVAEAARVLRPGGLFALSFDICEASMGMTFPEWNGRALTLAEFEELVWLNPAFDANPRPAWNTGDIPAFLAWHRRSAPHHNYIAGAAVVVRAGGRPVSSAPR